MMAAAFVPLGPKHHDPLAVLKRPTLPTLSASPFRWPDPKTIPPRQWVYGRHYARKYVSVTVAPGGVGKTSLTFGEAAAMASGRALLGGVAPKPSRVWVINLEDPLDELERRMAAVMLHFNLRPEDIGNRLFIDSGRTFVSPMKIATKNRDAIVIAKPVVDDLINAITSNGIDAVIIDPFVSSHDIGENDNGAIDAVAKAFAGIADTTNCAIELVHHVRKPASGQVDFTVDDARGAGALIGASRSARVLNQMTASDAETAGIDLDKRKMYFRVDNGKANMLPAGEKTAWFRLVGVPLGNDTEEEAGDWVGVVESWSMPDAMDNVSAVDLHRVQQKIVAGEWGADSQAEDWVGKAVADVLRLDLTCKRDKAKVKSMIATWSRTGAIKTEMVKDKRKGRDRPMAMVGVWAFGEPSSPPC